MSIVVALATVPRREAMLRRVVASLLPQCDRLCVYLNGHAAVPAFLSNPKVITASSREFGDRGDAGKFWWSDKLGADDYYFTVDDDIVYPDNYCRSFVKAIERFGRKAVVGIHGVVLPHRVQELYYRGRKVYPCTGSLSADTAVHILGTGALAYHVSTITVNPEDFRIANMADIWFGMLARAQRIPMICLSHAATWIDALPDPAPSHSIAGTWQSHNAKQAAVLRRANPWPDPITVAGVIKGQRPGSAPAIARGNMPAQERVNPTSGRSFGATVVDARGARSGASNPTKRMGVRKVT